MIIQLFSHTINSEITWNLILTITIQPLASHYVYICIYFEINLLQKTVHMFGRRTNNI